MLMEEEMHRRRLLLLILLFAIAIPSIAQDKTRSEPDGSYVTVNGKRLWYRSEGESSPLILVPGGPGASHTYLWPDFSSAKNSA
jgi:hypothetical protein